MILTIRFIIGIVSGTHVVIVFFLVGGLSIECMYYEGGNRHR